MKVLISKIVDFCSSPGSKTFSERIFYACCTSAYEIKMK